MLISFRNVCAKQTLEIKCARPPNACPSSVNYTKAYHTLLSRSHARRARSDDLIWRPLEYVYDGVIGCALHSVLEHMLHTQVDSRVRAS